MPNRCCVRECKSHENDDEKLSFHQFPLKNPSVFCQWINRVNRGNWKPNKSSVLCSKHFSKDSFVTLSVDSNSSRKRKCINLNSGGSAGLKKKYLKKDAVPTLFMNSDGENNSIETKPLALPASHIDTEYFDLLSLCDVVNLQMKLIPENFAYINNASQCCNSYVMFIKLNLDNGIPSVEASLQILDDFSVIVTFKSKVVDKSKYLHLLPTGKLNRIISIIEVLKLIDTWVNEDTCTAGEHLDLAHKSMVKYRDNVKVCDECNVDGVDFLIEQIKLLRKDNSRSRRYSTKMVIFSYILHSHSASAYRFIQQSNVILLPSIRHLRSISRKLMPNINGDVNVNEYLKIRSKNLSQYERYVVLILDEIYVAKRLEMSGGQITGLSISSDSKHSLASTLLCFMISSISSAYRDVVAIYPIDKINGETIFNCYNGVMNMLHKSGFQVIAICVDNLAANRKFYETFLCGGKLKHSIPNNLCNGDPIFLCFDNTHNIKNIYNNFITRKSFLCPHPQSEHAESINPKMCDIKELFDLETGKPLKIAYKLKESVFNPTSIQRMSTQLASSIFCDSTIAALQFYSTKCNKNWNDTYLFVSLIHKFWKVINVRSTSEGKRKRDMSCQPVTSGDDWKLKFLQEFSTFLMRWQSDFQPSHTLTRQTFLALRHTVEVLPKLASFLLNQCGFKYVLLGCILSDNLEERFGWYRQLCGGNYYLSVRQVLENERKIKCMSLMKYCALQNIRHTDISGNVSNIRDTSLNEICEKLLAFLAEYSRPKIESDDANCLYYVAGYVARSVVSRTKCLSCTSILKDEYENNCEIQVENDATFLLEEITRGGLWHPTLLTYDICIYCWQVFGSIFANSDTKNLFLSPVRQDELFYAVVSDGNVVQDITVTECEKGHNILRLIAISMFKIMTKNVIMETNRQICYSDLSRKIAKFSSISLRG